MPCPVKWFTSSMTGAPALSDTAGTLIAVLDACLINGFGSKTLNSLVIASNVATATVSTGHGFTDQTVILIAGATPPELNGEQRLTSVSSTTFTFATSGLADQTATGTITAKLAPAGWEKAYSATNKAAYRSLDPLAHGAPTPRLLRVDDTANAYYAGVTGYESMTGIDAGTAFTGALYAGKSYTADATARAWWLIADSRFFYLFANYRDGYCESLVFGDYLPVVPDAYAVFMSASTANSGGEGNSNNFFRFTFGSSSSNVYNTGRRLCRSYNGTGRPYAGLLAPGSFFVLGRAATNEGYPGIQGGNMYLDPVSVYEGDISSYALLRGQLPGGYSPRHNMNSSGMNGATVLGAAGQARAGVKLFCVGYKNGDNGYGTVAVDHLGPWR